ncbi:MAG: sensor histidine kinase [Candidatus Thiodiazotropha sp.]|jgi:signal transduction histidine kinase
MSKAKDNRSSEQIYDPITTLNSVYSMMQELRSDRVALQSRKVGNEPNTPARSGAFVREEHLLATVSNQLIDTEEEEKKRIARELHDGLGQLLTTINLHVQQCLNSTETLVKIPHSMKESLQAISSMTKQAMGEMRGICTALRPSILDDLGVLAAIRWQCRQITQAHDRLHVSADFDVHEAMIPEGYKTAIYRIVQEALNNAVKYARADNVSVKLYHAGDYLQLLIQDDGVGFDLCQIRAASEGMGQTSMRERADAVGGVFEIDSGVGEGVEIRVLFPLEKVVLSG